MALENSPTKSPVSTHTITNAVDALLKWLKSQAKNQKSQLLEHDEFVYLILTLRKIPPKGRTNPYKIPLPNPLHPFDSSEELCLIIDDRPKSSLTSEAAKKKIQSENIPVSKVLKLSKLKSDYRPFEAKRKLCSSYDLFFTDKRITHMLPTCLGKEFFKRKKLPIPVDLKHKNWKEQIEAACGSALLYLRTGTCSVVKVGRVSQGRDELVANIVAVIDGIAELVPKKWSGIRSFHLKLTDSLALPVYQTVPEIGLKIEGVKKEKEDKNVDSQAESGEESAGKSKRKRGRIHEVRFLENDVGQVLDDIFSGKEDDDDKENSNKDDDDKENNNKNVELDSAVLKSKKRRKEEKLNKKKDVISSEVADLSQDNVDKPVNGVKKSAKSKKKGGSGEKKDVISSEVADKDVFNGVKKSAESKKKGGAGKKKDVMSSEVEDKDVSDGVKRSAESNKKGKGVENKKRTTEEEQDDVVSVSSDVKKKKTKVGKTDTSGIKLKSKKSSRA